MDWSDEDILKNYENINNDKHILTQNDLDEKYKDFKKTFPKMYETILTNDHSYEHLKNMLSIRSKMKSKNISNVAGNVQAGEYLSRQYLYPVVGEPSLEQKKEALQKILDKDVENRKK